MKKVTIIVVGLLLIVLAIKLMNSFSININSKSASNPSNVTRLTQSSNGSLEPRENNEGPVAITITPLNLKDSSSTWNFEVALNTHSEELTEDLVAVSELVDDQGKSYKPISWGGTPPGGHHREGVLKFNPISPKPKSIELKIKNVGGAPERRFKWDL